MNKLMMLFFLAIGAECIASQPKFKKQRLVNEQPPALPIPPRFSADTLGKSISSTSNFEVLPANLAFLLGGQADFANTLGMFQQLDSLPREVIRSITYLVLAEMLPFIQQKLIVPSIVLADHTEGARSAEFNAEGDTVVTVPKDGTARIWDVLTGECKTVLEGHAKRVRSAKFNAEGDKVVTASEDGTARIWDVLTGECKTVLEGIRIEAIYQWMFNASGDKVIASGDDYGTRIWDVATGNCVLETGGFNVMLIASENKLVTNCDWGYDTTARIWNIGTGACEQEFKGHAREVVTARINAAGDKVVTSSRDKTVRIWNAATGTCEHVLVHPRQLWSAKFNAVGDKVVTHGSDKKVRIWDVATGVCGHVLRPRVWKVVVGDKLLTASYDLDNTVRIWDVGTGVCEQELVHPTKFIRVAKFNAVRDKVVTASADGAVRIWDVATGVCEQVLEGHNKSVEKVKFNAVGD